MAARRVAVTRRFELADPLFDAEEVRGSNPLAPTKTAGRRPVSSAADLFPSAEERLLAPAGVEAQARSCADLPGRVLSPVLGRRS